MTEDDTWQSNFIEFKSGLLSRVQGAAQTWLSSLSLLLGLYTTAVVVNGGSAIVDLPGGVVVRALAVAFAVAVFGLSMSAVAYGAMATFGGLGLLAESPPMFSKDWIDNLWNGLDLAADATWETYKQRTEQQAGRRRKYLHHSRVLGVFAGLVAGLFALLVLTLRAFASTPVPAPTDLIVVHGGGQVTCGAATTDAAGRVYVAGVSLSDATQLIRVDHC